MAGAAPKQRSRKMKMRAWKFEGGIEKLQIESLKFQGQIMCFSLATCEGIKSALETAGYTITVSENIPPPLDPDDPGYEAPSWTLMLERDIESELIKQVEELAYRSVVDGEADICELGIAREVYELGILRKHSVVPSH
jgi:hypothetical protein